MSPPLIPLQPLVTTILTDSIIARKWLETAKALRLSPLLFVSSYSNGGVLCRLYFRLCVHLA